MSFKIGATVTSSDHAIRSIRYTVNDDGEVGGVWISTNCSSLYLSKEVLLKSLDVIKYKDNYNS